MKGKDNTFVYIITLFALIVAAVITTTIINAVKSNQAGSQTDIRARAGVVNIVKLTGTVTGTDDTTNTITVSNVEFAPETRSGPPINYGTWTVTPPPGFNLNTALPGKTITFTINAASFDVSTHKVAASQVNL